jgi:predicted nucleic acid-binding protein
MPGTVLDSFALIAYFRGERMGMQVRDLLQKAGKADEFLHMTEVSYAEVKYMILRKNGAKAWEEVSEILTALPISFHPADRELADLAADMKSRFSFSVAAAFTAAMARKHEADLVTGDPEFKAVEHEVKVSWLARI